jgi:arylsulfatase A-like enzyme
VAKSNTPFFLNVNFMKVHQPNLPHPDFVHKSLSKSKYADSVVELDAHIGAIMDKIRALGLDKNTFVFYTTDNGAPGRTSIRTPATRPSAAPRARCGKAAIAFPPSPGGRARSPPTRRAMTSSAAST